MTAGVCAVGGVDRDRSLLGAWVRELGPLGASDRVDAVTERGVVAPIVASARMLGEVVMYCSAARCVTLALRPLRRIGGCNGKTHWRV